MGFSAFASTVAANGAATAASFISDMAPVFGLFAGVAAAGLVIMMFARFVGR